MKTNKAIACIFACILVSFLATGCEDDQPNDGGISGYTRNAYEASHAGGYDRCETRAGRAEAEAEGTPCN